MYEIKITCEKCGQWIGRNVDTYDKIVKIAEDACWIGVEIKNPYLKCGIQPRKMWYCSVCAKKVNIKEMMDSV